MLVSKLAAEQVKVVLSGDGGDELFWGYPRFAKVRKALPWFRLPHGARVAAYAASKPLPTPRRPARGIMFGSVGDWYLDAHSGLRDADLSTMTPSLGGLPTDFDLFRLDRAPSDDGLLQWMRGNELACHLPMILQKVNRASMFHSLEVRVPLLDLEMLDLAARVDPSACLEGTTGKQVLRHALGRHVPSEQIPVPKRGFTVPMKRWLREELRPNVEALLVDRDPFPSGLFDRAGLRAYCNRHLDGHADQTRGLWNLLSLQLWADTHLAPLSTLSAGGLNE
jgi:asparagine synthase (glutamine-hydrolysing)